MEALTYRMNNRQISFDGLTPPGLAHEGTLLKKANSIDSYNSRCQPPR
jgi:hypothetical protein